MQSFRIAKLLRSLSFSLAEHYPHFETRMRKALRAIVGDEAEKHIEVGMAKDGSGVGGKSLIRNGSKHH